MPMKKLVQDMQTMIDGDMDLAQVFAHIDQRCEAPQVLGERSRPNRPKDSKEKPRVQCRGLTNGTKQPCKARSEPGTKRCRWHTPKGARVVCGARRRRDGLPCTARTVPGKARCRWHGGASTGPRTSEGRVRSLANLKQFLSR
jgi:hypothetical protein